MLNELNAQQFPLLVAEHSAFRRLCGLFYFRPIQGFKHTVEHSVFIHADFIGQGLGKALMLKLIEHAGKMLSMSWSVPLTMKIMHRLPYMRN